MVFSLQKAPRKCLSDQGLQNPSCLLLLITLCLFIAFVAWFVVVFLDGASGDENLSGVTTHLPPEEQAGLLGICFLF